MDCIICYKIFIKEIEFADKPAITTQHSDLASNVGDLLSITPKLVADALRKDYVCYNCMENFSEIDGLYKEIDSIKSKLSNHKDEVKRKIFYSKTISDAQFSNGRLTSLSESSSARLELFEELKIQERDDETSNIQIVNCFTVSTGRSLEIISSDETNQVQEIDSKIDIEYNPMFDTDPLENSENMVMEPIVLPHGTCKFDVNDEPKGPNQSNSQDEIILIDISQILNGSKDGNKSDPVPISSNSNEESTLAVSESDVVQNQNEKIKYRTRSVTKSMKNTTAIRNHESCLNNVVNTTKSPKVLRCKDCHKPFTSSKKYQDHTTRTIRSVSTKCKFINCNKEFNRLGCIRYHNCIEHHNGKKMTSLTTIANDPVQIQKSAFNFCQICQIKFDSNKDFKEHNKILHGITDSNNCPICHKHFTNNYTVRSHLLIHLKINPFTCSIEGCAESFRRKDMLINHEKNHSSTKPSTTSRRRRATQTFTCSLCPLQFPLQELLRQHSAFEHEEYHFYPCRKSGCIKKFKLEIVRNEHEKKHKVAARREIEVCSYCSKSFRSKNTLAAHVNMIHTKERTFICPHINCGKKFIMHQYLKKHLKSHEPKQTKIKISCNKKVKSSTGLKNHLRI